MDQYIEFIGNHPYKIALFVIILVLVVVNELRRKAAGAKSLPPMLATGIINDDNSIVVDLRPSGEFKHGHIIGARNISFTDFKDQAEKLSADKAAPVLLCCKNGLQSPEAARQLKALGYENVYVLSGGIAAWTADSMPLEK